jgi:hypothetical protein
MAVLMAVLMFMAVLMAVLIGFPSEGPAKTGAAPASTPALGKKPVAAKPGTKRKGVPSKRDAAQQGHLR